MSGKLHWSVKYCHMDRGELMKRIKELGTENIALKHDIVDCQLHESSCDVPEGECNCRVSRYEDELNNGEDDG